MQRQEPDGWQQSIERLAEARPTTPPAARVVFGDRLSRAERFVALLATHGVERGLIGPREVDRLWERHVLNSAVLADAIEPAAATGTAGVSDTGDHVADDSAEDMAHSAGDPAEGTGTPPAEDAADRDTTPDATASRPEASPTAPRGGRMPSEVREARRRRVVDVGTGAGLPGVPLALARPDLDIVLLEPMARRVEWLAEVADTLDLDITVERGRAEEKAVRSRLGAADIVTARAVAPLARLAGWCLPLLRPGGTLLALKGRSAAEEIERDERAIRQAGGGEPRIVECGVGVLETPTIVVVIERTAPEPSSRGRSGRGAQTERVESRRSGVARRRKPKGH